MVLIGGNAYNPSLITSIEKIGDKGLRINFTGGTYSDLEYDSEERRDRALTTASKSVGYAISDNMEDAIKGVVDSFSFRDKVIAPITEAIKEGLRR